MRRLKPLTFPSSGSHPVQLEGRLHLLEGEGQWPAAVVCHPHPLGGGSMHNNVVVAIARALISRGVMALTFNFRGVGRSGGQHDDGRGEQADVAGALDWLLAQPEVDPWRVSLVGYSFGAWVGLAHARSDPRAAAVAAVGLAAWHYDAEFYQANAHFSLGAKDWQFEPDFLHSFTRPKLFITGAHDPFAPPEALHGLVDRLPPPKILHVVPGADHFLLGHEQEVGELVAEFIAGL
jgi:alpha/beta superfamily hydrolase